MTKLIAAIRSGRVLHSFRGGARPVGDEMKSHVTAPVLLHGPWASSGVGGVASDLFREVQDQVMHIKAIKEKLTSIFVQIGWRMLDEPCPRAWLG
jgi:hypothetical protein